MTVGQRRGNATSTLDLAVLGLLAEEPMHGYQLRTRLTETLGPVRSYSYGSLYPALRRLEAGGHIAVQDGGHGSRSSATAARRTRVTYRLTPVGRALLAEMLAEVGPSSWTDEGFGVRLALFARTPVDARLQLLRGRCHRLERQREGLLTSAGRDVARPVGDTAALHRLTIAAHDRELLWLRGLVAREQHLAATDRPTPPQDPQSTSDPPSREVLS